MSDIRAGAPGAVDLDAFHAFEAGAWERIADSYHAVWPALTRQAIPAVLDILHAGPGTKLLDVACGSGFLANEAAARGAAVVGIDFSSSMVDIARGVSPGIDFRQGDAHALAFDDRSFDAVAMNFGMLHLAEPSVAIREASRVLRPGGRFAFTVWDIPERAAGFAVILDAVAEHGQPVDIPAGPDFFRYSTPARAREELERAGFNGYSTREIAITWRVASAHEFCTAFHDGSARTGELLRGQNAETLSRIESAVAGMLARFVTADGSLRIPMPAILNMGIRRSD